MLPGGQLAVALVNNNALAVYHWLSPSEPVSFLGMVPTGWYPGDIAVDPARKSLVVANVKGVGSLGNAGSPSKAAYAQVGGIASDEGHQWLDEAWVTSYLEKMEYGGPERA
jgi:hypothetical protein